MRPRRLRRGRRLAKPEQTESLTGAQRLLLLDTWRRSGLPAGDFAPLVGLSNARTQWGVCTEGGSIRLSWRLVHLEPALADYVVAHEVAHLVELNHSKRCWSVLAKLYPDWRAARERLELAGASLPIIQAAL